MKTCYLGTFSILLLLFIILPITITPINATPGDASTNPIEIDVGITNGSLPGPATDESIWYNISLSGNYNFSLSGEVGTDFDLELYRKNIYSNYLDYIGTADSDSYPDNLISYDLHGVYLINIYSYEGLGLFSLNISKLPSILGDSFYNPQTIDLGLTNGSIPGPAIDGTFWYNISLDGNYEFNLTGDDNTNFDLDIYDGDYDYIAYTNTTNYPAIETIYGMRGIYHLNINVHSGTGWFTLNITEIPQTPGDSFINPISTFLGSTKGSLPGPSITNSIWYEITLSGNYIFNLTGAKNSDFDFAIYDDDYNYVSGAYRRTYPDVSIEYGLYGTFLIFIYADYGYGLFEFNITHFPSILGDSKSNPKSITAGTTRGYMPGPSEDQSTWFNVSLSGNYLFNLTGDTETDFAIILYDNDGHRIDSEDRKSYPELIYAKDLDGSYLIEIESQGTNGSFELSIIEIGPISGLLKEDAITINIGITNGTLLDDDFDIWYKLTITTDFVDYAYTFILSGDEETDFDIDIYDNNDTLIDGSYGVTYPDTITLENPSGIYYIVISSLSKIGGYGLEIIVNEIKFTTTSDTTSTTSHSPIIETEGSETEPKNYNENMTNYILLIILISLLPTVFYIIKMRRKNSYNISKETELERSYDEPIASLKLCIVCGQQLLKGSKYCDYCGVRQN